VVSPRKNSAVLGLVRGAEGASDDRPHDERYDDKAFARQSRLPGLQGPGGRPPPTFRPSSSAEGGSSSQEGHLQFLRPALHSPETQQRYRAAPPRMWGQGGQRSSAPPRPAQAASREGHLQFHTPLLYLPDAQQHYRAAPLRMWEQGGHGAGH
jgi:hypothetical protein